jgi:hypothetical protein
MTLVRLHARHKAAQSVRRREKRVITAGGAVRIQRLSPVM